MDSSEGWDEMWFMSQGAKMGGGAAPHPPTLTSPLFLQECKQPDSEGARADHGGQGAELIRVWRDSVGRNCGEKVWIDSVGRKIYEI